MVLNQLNFIQLIDPLLPRICSHAVNISSIMRTSSNRNTGCAKNEP